MKIKDVDRFLRLAEEEQTRSKGKAQKTKKNGEDWKGKTAKKPVEKRRWRSQ